MKSNFTTLLMMAAVALALTACHSNDQHLASADGSVQATLRNGQWIITDSAGREPVEAYDSMRVTETTADGKPTTVIYYKGADQYHRQYFSNMQLRSEGRLHNGRREGRWVYYHPNGLPQVEAEFVDGKEEGPYRVYRDNGAPYYIGQYSAGTPTGLWEVYDDEGNLVEKTEY